MFYFRLDGLRHIGGWCGNSKWLCCWRERSGSRSFGYAVRTTSQNNAVTLLRSTRSTATLRMTFCVGMVAVGVSWM